MVQFRILDPSFLNWMYFLGAPAVMSPRVVCALDFCHHHCAATALCIRNRTYELGNPHAHPNPAPPDSVFVVFSHQRLAAIDDGPFSSI